MERILINRVVDEGFYKMHKWAMHMEPFDKLSNDARIAYMLLRDRHELSVKNNWVNERGEVFLYFAQEELGLILNSSLKTVRKRIVELKECGLLEVERQGQGKPNRLFLTAPSLENALMGKVYPSARQGGFTHQDREGLPTNKTYSNKTEIIHNNNNGSGDDLTVDNSETKDVVVEIDKPEKPKKSLKALLSKKKGNSTPLAVNRSPAGNEGVLELDNRGTSESDSAQIDQTHLEAAAEKLGVKLGSGDIKAIYSTYKGNRDLLKTILEDKINNPSRQPIKNLVGYLKAVRDNYQTSVYVEGKKEFKTGFHLPETESRGKKYTNDELEKILLGRKKVQRE